MAGHLLRGCQLWEQTSKVGTTFLRGRVGDVRILILLRRYSPAGGIRRVAGGSAGGGKAKSRIAHGAIPFAACK